MLFKEKQYGINPLSGDYPLDNDINLRISGIEYKKKGELYSWSNSQRDAGCIFQYTLSGEGRFVDEHLKEHVISPGKAFLVSMPSSTRYYLADGNEWEFMFVRFYGKLCLKYVQQITKDRGHIIELSQDSAAIQKLFLIYKESIKVEGPDLLACSGAIIELLGSLMINSRENSYPENIYRAIRFMEAQFTDPDLCIDDIADASGYSKSHFTREFKKHTGMTPHQYLKKIRLNEATIYLKNTNYKVAEIAELTGYNHIPHFCTEFKKEFNSSPGEFRIEN